MAVTFFNRNIPDECHQKMKDFTAAGEDIAWVAFAPGAGAHWSIVTASGAYFNRNIPDECHQQMGELSKNGARIVCVAFAPGGGWSIVNSNGAYFNRNIPQECHEKMGEMSKNGSRVICVAFPPGGGNSWSIVASTGAYMNRNIPQECHDKMGELAANGAKITCVAFPPNGGNSWSVVNDRGAYFNRNINEEAHMYMGYFSQVYGPVKIVAFDGDGNGWSVTSAVTKHESVCDDAQCVAIADVYKNIADRLNGRVVGYACTVGRGARGAFSKGYARTSADAPAKLFLPSTKITVASVSKIVTAIAAVALLGKKNVALDTAIGKYVPSDWKLDPYVASITFRELLQHRSGIKDYGNTPQDYASLKTFFTQKVDKTKNIACQGSAVQNPANPFNPNNKNPCYSNYNFAIFRILLPIVNGFVDDPANRAQKLADSYIRLVQKHVFEPVGAMGVDAKPPESGPQADAYAYAYAYPGTSAGFTWGDNSAGVGAAGWYLSIDDIARVLDSLNRNDERILTSAQVQDMEATRMGWDATTDGSGYRWVEKNGGWGANGTTISTSVALLGPGVYGALFMNSDYGGPGMQNNWKQCAKCHGLVFAGSASAGTCPAGGSHDNKTNGRNYLVPTTASNLSGQENWRWCKKCQGLFYSAGGSGDCPSGGSHDSTGSGAYELLRNSGSTSPVGTQDNFRYCKKCRVLALADSESTACSAGGKHDYTGSSNYYLDYAVGADTVLLESYKQALKPKSSASAG